MRSRAVRVLVMLGVLLFAAMLLVCAWWTVPRNHVEGICPPLAVQATVSRLSQGAREVDIRMLTVAQQAIVRIDHYSIYGHGLAIGSISQQVPYQYVPLDPQVIKYTVTNNCGSSQTGTLFVWP